MDSLRGAGTGRRRCATRALRRTGRGVTRTAAAAGGIALLRAIAPPLAALALPLVLAGTVGDLDPHPGAQPVGAIDHHPGSGREQLPEGGPTNRGQKRENTGFKMDLKWV